MSIEQCGLVVIHFLKDGFHKGLANEATAIRYAIPIAETIQRAELTFVEHDRYSKIARLLLHGGEGLWVTGYGLAVRGARSRKRVSHLHKRGFGRFSLRKEDHRRIG